MSLPEISNVNSQSFASQVWNYDEGKARRRAFIMASVTTAVLTPIIFRHYFFWHRVLKWHVWFQAGPPHIRHPGLPYYWIDTVVAGALIAILANAITGFFATVSARNNLWIQLRRGVTYALIFPGLATLSVNRYRWEYGNSPIMITLLMWLPLAAGAIVGVRMARRNNATPLAKPDPRSQIFSSDSYYVSYFLRKAWNAGPSSCLRRILTVIVLSIAILRLDAFIRGS